LGILGDGGVIVQVYVLRFHEEKLTNFCTFTASTSIAARSTDEDASILRNFFDSLGKKWGMQKVS